MMTPCSILQSNGLTRIPANLFTTFASIQNLSVTFRCMVLASPMMHHISELDFNPITTIAVGDFASGLGITSLFALTTWSPHCNNDAGRSGKAK